MQSRRDDRTLLLTGVAGFIGSALARRLVADGYRIVGVDDLSSGRASNIPPEVELVEGDLSTPSTLSLLPRRIGTILHLAGQSSGEMSFDDPVCDLRKNTVSTLLLSEYASSTGAQRLIYASSMSVYGSVPDSPVNEVAMPAPLSCYGVGKAAAERYLQIFSDRTPYVVLRMFNVYGPGQDMTNLRQGMVSIYLAQAMSMRRIVVKGSPRRYRDFIFIDDVIEAWFQTLARPEVRNQVINVATGRRTEVGELLKEIQSLVPGTDVEFTDGTIGDQFGIFADTNKLTSHLGLSSFVKLREGLERFIGTLKSQKI